MYTRSFSHEGDTHVNITNTAVDYLFQIDPVCVSKDNLKMDLDVGARGEDAFPRYFFHFLPRLNNLISFLNPVYVSASCDAVQWGFASQTICVATIPTLILSPIPSVFPMLNDHTWNDAVTNTCREQGRIHLGYVVHLLEDMA